MVGRFGEKTIKVFKEGHKKLKKLGFSSSIFHFARFKRAGSACICQCLLPFEPDLLP